MKTIRVLIVDDHKVVLESLGYLLNIQEGLEVVGLTTSGEGACKLTGTLKPDVVVMDVSMPGIGGALATKRILERYSPIKVVAFSGHNNQAHVSHMLEAGAIGYISKQAPVNEIIQIIRDAALNENAPMQAAKPDHKKLSVQETQILRMNANGMRNYEMAKILNVSIKSIETYKRRIKDKLGVTTKSEMIEYARVQGWLESEA